MNGNRPSFEDAVTRLNSKNLDTLLETSCMFSCIEFYGGMNSQVFPLLNNEKCRLFSEAIVASKAASYKDAVLGSVDLAYVLNGVSEALNDPRVASELISGKPRDELLYAAQRFFARMANIQIRQQEIRLSSTVGRLLALLSVIPQRDIGEFETDKQAVVRQVVEAIPKVLGANLRELASVYMLLYLWHQRVNASAWNLFESTRPAVVPGQTQKDRQAWTIYRLSALAPRLRGYIVFNPESLRSLLRVSPPADAVSAFIDIFSKPIGEIRGEGRKPPYQIGPVGWRLSPLERYPVVKLDSSNQRRGQGEGSRFIIPNVRTFLRSFSDVIHFTLQERLGNVYNEVRGLSQEVYLRLLIRDRLPSCTPIPEIPYRSPKGEKKGPDCTIIDRQARRLIMVESKARRVLVETRFTMAEEIFDLNFAPVYELLLRAQDKIEDLYAGLPEYAQYQAEIDSTKGSPPICVAGVAESVYMLNEIVRFRARSEAGHPLQNYPWIFRVMSLESFDLAVEIAASEGISLTQVLEEFWEDSSTMEPSSSMSDSFRQRMVKKGSSFAESFLKTSDLLAAQDAK